MGKYKKSKKEILRKISEDFIEFIDSFSDLIVNMVLPFYSGIRIDGFPRNRYYYNLRKFEKNGFLRKIRKNNHIVYILTSRAKQLRKNPTKKIDRSDGLATIIIFDIPENKRSARVNFRRYLIRNGYTQIQKSVFISPFKIFNEMLEFISEMQIQDNVTFLSGKIDRF